MTPDQPAIDWQLHEQIRQSKSMTPDERVREGLRLSDLALQVMRDAIRAENPFASDEEIDRLVMQRRERIRKIGQIR